MGVDRQNTVRVIDPMGPSAELLDTFALMREFWNVVSSRKLYGCFGPIRGQGAGNHGIAGASCDDERAMDANNPLP